MRNEFLVLNFQVSTFPLGTAIRMQSFTRAPQDYRRFRASAQYAPYSIPVRTNIVSQLIGRDFTTGEINRPDKSCQGQPVDAIPGQR
jgi:hypothetical protein